MILGACSGHGPLGALVPVEPLTTGSLAAGPPPPARDLTLGLRGEALARASAALAEALDPIGPGGSVSWASAESGLRGSITAAAAPRVEAALVCRRFVAETLREAGAPTRHEGRACRTAARTWRIEEAAEIRGTRPASADSPPPSLPLDLVPRPAG
ncbi:MAG: RT0821/Lpp0805 family surface protein [Salinarimonas sp.]